MRYVIGQGLTLVVLLLILGFQVFSMLVVPTYQFDETSNKLKVTAYVNTFSQFRVLEIEYPADAGVTVPSGCTVRESGNANVKTVLCTTNLRTEITLQGNQKFAASARVVGGRTYFAPFNTE